VSETIFLTGGGTGGHVYPAVAVAQALRAREADTRFVYCGVAGGIEQSIAQKNDMSFCAIRSVPYPGLSQPLRFIRFGIILLLGTLQAVFHLLRFRPAVLVATGGYVAAPCVFAAVLLRALRLVSTRIFVHEQNMAPGRLNRLVAQYADAVGVSFHGSEGYLPGAPVGYVGYPVRPALRLGTPGDDTQLPAVLQGIPEGRRIVLAFGGSQGARTVNRAVVDALSELQRIEDIFVIHGVGRQQRGGYNPEADVSQRLAAQQIDRPLEDFYRSVAYIDDIGTVYRAASLIVSRSGAGTVKELCAMGRPAVLIPKAGLSGDHQVMNALVFEQAGAGRVVLEQPRIEGSELVPAVCGERLAKVVGDLLSDRSGLSAMAKAASTLDDPQAMERILAALSAPIPAQSVSVESGESVEVRYAEQTPGQLLDAVRAWRRKNPKRSVRTIEGLAYLEYRAASMMTAAAWRVRNVGVKLAGLLDADDLTPLLLHLLEDPTPASRLARMVGGERRQNGFIRRNVLHSLIQIGTFDKDVSAAVHGAIGDTYFEVRREACRAIQVLSVLHKEPWVCDALRVSLRDRSFEVRMVAIGAVGVAFSPEQGLPLLEPFYFDPNWKLREAVLRAFERWAQDGGPEVRELLKHAFRRVLLTAGGYRPVFGLKETASRVAGSLVEEKAS
jgi:UDP-N-acetylglucosamine--N-acetylmuramyl-(pentapeptide) pyrophosphoryl-undecaprenol N-acetylglucosamine transferase